VVPGISDAKTGGARASWRSFADPCQRLGRVGLVPHGQDGVSADLDGNARRRFIGATDKLATMPDNASVF
jgi:hypothetical protein